MKLTRLLFRILAALALVGLVLAAYFLLARPYRLHWGATEEEVARPMPGDELNPAPAFRATRAITIEGTPEEIWPWLVQMGFGRAGFYGYDLLENLGSPGGLRSAERILPEFQDFQVGDAVPLSAAGGLEFSVIDPYRFLVWAGDQGWGGITWALYPIDADHTRLVSRVRFSYNTAKPELLAFDLFTEFSDHLAVAKILQGVKGRVEGRIEPAWVADLEFAVYLVAILLFLGAIILLLIRPLTWRGWLAGLAAGATWLVIWYAPISVWISVLLELVALGGLVLAFRRPSTPVAV
jgi:hypothetical protein